MPTLVPLVVLAPVALVAVPPTVALSWISFVMLICTWAWLPPPDAGWLAPR